MLKQYYKPRQIEVGIDEAGRGCLFGPVCISGVIWVDKDPYNDKRFELKDSKKCTPKKRELLKKYIEDTSIGYSVKMIDNEAIDVSNILQSTINGMHLCLDDITSRISIDQILVDGNQFNLYFDKECNMVPYECIIDGDNKYKSIAAASILAKTYRDEYIKNLVEDNPELLRYDIHNNKGYGTQKHLNAIKEYGITKWHRKTFGICKEYN